jgi:chromosome segregation ATPase
MKRFISATIAVLCLASLSSCGVKKETYESVVAEASQANENLESVNAELESANASAESFSNAYDSMSNEYAEYKESMSEYEGLSADEAQAREIQAQSIAESSRVAASEAESASIAESQAAEAASIAASQEAEKVGYDTGITYDQLARTPDQYKGQKVKFRGKVVQVIEGDTEVSIRLATKGSYDDILYCQYDKTIVSSRVLEDDTITIYGMALGTISYESTMGGQITIPAVAVDRIDQ